MNENYKVIFKQIAFEITRKCNMTCRHCMRGEAQNKTISKEVIDRFLDEVSMAYKMILTGGEPFLEPEMICYLFDEIIRREIPLWKFSCVTNGSIRDKSIADAWNRLADYIASRHKPTGDSEADRKYLRAIGEITVSNDPYHQLDYDPLDTVKWYREHLNNHCIIRKEVIKPNEVDTIHILGRAAEQEDLRNSKGAFYPVCPYKIEVSNDGRVVDTCIMVGWDGKLLIGEDSSYEQQDKVNYGNIFDGHISELIEKGIFTEPFSKVEASKYNAVYTLLKTDRTNAEVLQESTREMLKTLMEYFNAVYTAREICFQMFPWMSFDKVVETVYDDMNIKLRKTNDNPKIFRIDDYSEYDVTIEESIQRTKIVKLQGFFMDYPSLVKGSKMLNADIKPVPVKIWDETLGGTKNAETDREKVDREAG